MTTSQPVKNYPGKWRKHEGSRVCDVCQSRDKQIWTSKLPGLKEIARCTDHLPAKATT